jgi:EmrB/QacA subfamily drug resistance transporter
MSSPDSSARLTTQGESELSHAQVLVVFSALMIGMLLAALDQTIMATALPTIVGELGGVQQLSWVITSYLLTSTASVLVYGKMSDVYGRKPLFLGAIVVFIGGSILSGLSQSMAQLIIFRGVQGLGAGGIMSMAQAIIGDIVSPRARGRYMGYVGGVFALASVGGPLLGGLFVDHLSWRWVFYINVPLGIAAFTVTLAVLKLPMRKRVHSIDYLGAALMIAGVSCLLLLTSWGGVEYAWDSVTIVGLGVAGVCLLAIFIARERVAPDPLLPLRLFRETIFSVGSIVGFVVGLAIFGALAFLPLYLQLVEGASATESGLKLAPLMMGLVLTSVVSGRIISDTGRYRVFPIAGSAVMAVGLFLLSRLGAATPYWEAAIYMGVMGIGAGMVMQVIVLAVQNAVDYRDLGIATAGANFFRSMGSAFGVAIFGSILSNRLSHNLQRFLPQDSSSSLDVKSVAASPEQLHALPAAVQAGIVHAYAESLQTVFLLVIPAALIAFVFSFFMRELPLRDRAHVGVQTLVEEGPGLAIDNSQPETEEPLSKVEQR